MHFLHALRFIGIHHAIAFALSHSDVTLPQDHALTSRTNEEYQNTLIAIRDYLDIQPAVSDCMENSQIDYSRLCIDSAMDYQFRDRVAIIMTLCELSTSEYQPAPMECTEAGFSNKKCMNAFMRSPQQWTTYSSHMHNIRNSCYRYQREHDIDIARELYRNATEGQIEFLRASHEQQLAVLQVSDTTYRQVQTMENSLDIFQERISQLEMLLSGDIYIRLEAVIGALEKVAKDAIPSVFRDQMLHLEHFNKEQNAVLMKGAQQVILFLHESIQHSMEAQEQRGVDTANKLNYGLRSALFQLSKDLQTASYSMQREFRQGVTEISSDMVNQQQVMKEQVEQSLVPLEAYTSVLSQQVGHWSSAAAELLTILESAVDSAASVKRHHQGAMEHVDTMVHHTELSGDQLIARLDQSVLHVNETASRLSELHADYYWNTSNWLTSYLGTFRGLPSALRYMLWLVLFLQARSVLILCANTLCPVFTFLKLALSGSFLLAAEMCRYILYIRHMSLKSGSTRALDRSEKGWIDMDHASSASTNNSNLSNLWQLSLHQESSSTPAQVLYPIKNESLAARCGHGSLVPAIRLPTKVNSLQRSSQPRFSRIPEYLIRSPDL